MHPRHPSDLKPGILANLRYDLPAGLVVFLVALPLSLGIALASEAPLFAGIVAGVVAGIVVSMLSGSHLSVSGPAAGLTVIVAASIKELGSYEIFLCAVLIGGAVQILLGFLKAGNLASFFPTAVIEGMLSAIGITIFLKQIPHALGGGGHFENELEFWHFGGPHSTVGQIVNAVLNASTAAVVIALLSILLLVLWESRLVRRNRWLSFLPGPLITVLIGIALNEIFHFSFPHLGLTAEDGHLVQLPRIEGFQSLRAQMNFPDFSAFGDKKVWTVGLTIAAVASIQTLLSIESTDKLDPFRRTSNTNRELFAQGTGNLLSGMLGGLPLTSVVVRSSAAIYAGARTRMASFYHGAILLLAMLSLQGLLNLIPLASLASVLLVVGYKLARPALFKRMYRSGLDQFVPFVITVAAILLTDLLTGVMIGLVVGLALVIKASYYSAVTVVNDGLDFLVTFTKDVTFVHKLKLKRELGAIPDGARVVLDGTRTMFIDHDIYEVIRDFQERSEWRGIRIDMRNLDQKKFSVFKKGGH